MKILFRAFVGKPKMNGLKVNDCTNDKTEMKVGLSIKLFE